MTNDRGSYVGGDDWWVYTVETRELEKWKIKIERERDPDFLLWNWVKLLILRVQSYFQNSLSSARPYTVVYNFLETNERDNKKLDISGRFSANESKTCGGKKSQPYHFT